MSHSCKPKLTSVSVQSVTYTTSMLLPLEADYSILKLGSIVAILVDDDKSVHFVLKKISAPYVTGMGMYRLSDPSDNMLCESYTDLLDHTPLTPYEKDGVLYIVLKYALLPARQ